MKTLTEQSLRDYIDHETYLQRGRAYFAAGDVVLDQMTDHTIKARVVGTQVYRTTLALDRHHQLSGQCTCPAFRDYGPCKHLAAVGLAALALNEGGYEPSEDCQERIRQQDTLRRALSSLDKEDLIALILQHLGDDEEFYLEVCEE